VFTISRRLLKAQKGAVVCFSWDSAEINEL
jgi:hypothetical protein